MFVARSLRFHRPFLQYTLSIFNAAMKPPNHNFISKDVHTKEGALPRRQVAPTLKPPHESGAASRAHDGDMDDSAYARAKLLLADVSNKPYTSSVTRARVALKIPNADPEDLREGWQEALAAELQDTWSVACIYVRKGCIQLVLELQGGEAGQEQGENAGMQVMRGQHVTTGALLALDFPACTGLHTFFVGDAKCVALFLTGGVISPSRLVHAVGREFFEGRSVVMQQDGHSPVVLTDGQLQATPGAAATHSTVPSSRHTAPSQSAPNNHQHQHHQHHLHQQRHHSQNHDPILQQQHSHTATSAAAVASTPIPDLLFISPACACIASTPDETLVLHAAGVQLQPAVSAECCVRHKGAYLPCQAVVYDPQVRALPTVAGRLPPALAAAPGVDVVVVAVQLPPGTTGLLAVEAQRGAVLGASRPVLVLDDAAMVEEVGSMEAQLRMGAHGATQASGGWWTQNAAKMWNRVVLSSLCWGRTGCWGF